MFFKFTISLYNVKVNDKGSRSVDFTPTHGLVGRRNQAPHTPGYNDSIRATKCLRRQLERRWRTTGLDCDRLAYCLQRQLVTSSIHLGKLEYHMSQIAYASGDQKKLFKIVAKLLHTDLDTPLPTCDSFNALAEQFSERTNLENPV